MSNLKATSKSYKRPMDFYINKCNQNIENKLRKFKSTNSKDYWKIIDSVIKNKDKETLNEQDHDVKDDIHINTDITDDDKLLNSYITEGETLKCTKLLKINKSSANDRIINEYIKSTTDMMLPTYVAFFYLFFFFFFFFFNCGIVPEPWLRASSDLYTKTWRRQNP